MILIRKNCLKGGKNIYLVYWVDLSLYKYQETQLSICQLVGIWWNTAE